MSFIGDPLHRHIYEHNVTFGSCSHCAMEIKIIILGFTLIQILYPPSGRGLFMVGPGLA